MNHLIKLLHLLPPEVAHDVTLKALKTGLVLVPNTADDPILASTVCGLSFPNPVGLAAGFDKNADVVLPMLRHGFGFVEAGTVTPRPQIGNPKPRLFRIPEHQAVINRMGFNNKGLDVFVEAFSKAVEHKDHQRGIIGANIGCNKDVQDPIADYVTGFKAVAPLADYVTINVSSPNTPGLRGLQNRDKLEELVKAVLNARAGSPKKPPLFVKIAPDLEEQAVADIADIIQANSIDGVIVSNTTLDRPANLSPFYAQQAGGLSGMPLREKTNKIIAMMYGHLKGRIPIIGVGGISNADDAYEKIKMGANLIQIYTALAYKGPQIIHDIKQGLISHLRRDGFSTIQDAVGTTSK